MSKERDTINQIIKVLPGSAQHLNCFFESDAEQLDFQGNKMLFTMDDFSQEDFFRDDNPYVLGWNLAVGTLSDILASGGTPVFYAHSMMIDSENWNDKYITVLSQGIADVLKKYKCGFIGGDTGQSDCWRYTGVAIGQYHRALSRKGAQPGHILCMTGSVGAGNLEAALKLYTNKNLIGKAINKFRMYLPLRLTESELISQYATSCIDSSDGTLSALNTLAEINEVGYVINNLPYIKEGILASKVLGKPKVMLFLGECGEYELVFTINKEDENDFFIKSAERKLQIHKIGEISVSQNKTLITKKGRFDLGSFNIHARDFVKIDDYLNELSKYAKKHE